MILDFNSDKIKFCLKDIVNYNVDVIDRNIMRYKKFMYKSAVSDTFDKIFASELFQLSLWDNGTNTLDDLLILYNSIAANGLIGDEILPEIDKKILRKQLEIRDFKIKRTTSYTPEEGRKSIYRVKKYTDIWE